ncbi:hypothetical protein A2767_06265 [Candidatus Roizmanbacteria bacterium RIFCSPHIGHO2_01_FULL_35_10]|uniref:Uncharacterized protein n=1 Tax=Candidatus Roizmanbacteria bacterium RIFCSPLOWO2_01_FULL_35_13 TaxID=1802055 RepID=A0A1F7I6N2_9BACT|nr:MAG: hypothetical protein A2767_06265 [Candidatus Roizmanbacteria bacterium RIFCSPHIGHO2_01_FULL_35_10]OGK39013.1 MAG: hypothetical protein A3A74_06800 [Candidatus Roizmanbacteria bacterium RIFCSPLOWO2_01_FULL_35_13]
MKSKKEIIDHLHKGRKYLNQVIFKVDKDLSCLEVHKLLVKIIHQLEKSKKDLLNQFLKKSSSILQT